MTELSLVPYDSVEAEQFPQEIKIVIRKTDFQNIQFQNSVITFPITGCNFKKLIIENNEEIDFEDISVAFINCYVEDILVENISTKKLSIHFSSSIVSGKIKNCTESTVSFNNSILINSFFLLDVGKVEISYTEENIFPREWRSLFRRVSITRLKEVLDRKQSYYIHDCTRVYISSNEKENSKGGYYLRDHEKNKEHKLGYKLTPEQKKLLNINLSLKYDQSKHYKETKISGLSLNSVMLSGTPDSKISFENLRITNWHIFEFQPTGEAMFYNIAPLENRKGISKIEFHKSNLDNTWFDSIDFSEYSEVSFYRTKFSKTIFTSCSFPRDYSSLENIHTPDKKQKNYFKDRYEVYLQLKMALEATSNFHEAQKVYATANDALRKISDIPVLDKLILCVNRISNNHGLSIARPFILFLVFTILFYLMYLYSLDRIFNNYEFDYTLIGYYFSFIDLTHRNDFLVENSEFNAFSLAIDYSTKVLVSFFIYQFVAAFRKYGRK